HARRGGRHGAQGGPVAEVDVPVIGASQRERVHDGALPAPWPGVLRAVAPDSPPCPRNPPISAGSEGDERPDPPSAYGVSTGKRLARRESAPDIGSAHHSLISRGVSGWTTMPAESPSWRWDCCSTR